MKVCVHAKETEKWTLIAALFTKPKAGNNTNVHQLVKGLTNCDRSTHWKTGQTTERSNSMDGSQLYYVGEKCDGLQFRTRTVLFYLFSWVQPPWPTAVLAGYRPLVHAAPGHLHGQLAWLPVFFCRYLKVFLPHNCQMFFQVFSQRSLTDQLIQN